MTEELGSIGVRLKVDLSDLDRAETAANRKIKGIAREHTISFKVGAVNTAEVQKQIRAIAQGKLDVKVGVSLSASAGRQLHSQLQAQLKAAGPVKVNVTADLSTAEINKIKAAIGKAGIKLTGSGAGAGATTASPSAPITPHERKVIAETATAIAKGVKTSGGATTTRSAPAAPVAAAGPTAPAKPRTARQAHAATQAATRPAGLSAPIADFGGLPSGPAVGVSYAPDETGRRRVVPEPTKGVGKRLSRAGQRAQSQGMSLNTLKREKARPAQIAPEDEEYASRPSQVRVPMTEYEQELAERNLRGVRGAGRSGARQRNEPVLTAAERQAIGDKQDIMAEEASTEANERVRAPARKSKAYFGALGSRSPAFQRIAAGVQFTRFDPALAEAQKALEGGDLQGARAALRGFSGQLAGADPRQRKKFFRLFRNVENAPPEVLEKHAALQSLFAEIGIQEAANRVSTTQATLAPYRKGKGGKELRETAPDAYQEALEAAKAAKRFEDQMLRGLRPRAAGGPVGGGLMARLAAAKAAKAAYLVGETKPELFVGKSGHAEIVGEHGPEIRTFSESGKIEPHVPEWVRRGMAKDLTHRQGGGSVQSSGLLAQKGRYITSDVAGQEAAFAKTGLAVQGAGVQRVFVVNMPAAGLAAGRAAGAPRGGSVAAGPLRFGSDEEAAKWGQTAGSSAGKAFADLVSGTTPVKAETPSPAAGGATLNAFERQQARLQARGAAAPLTARIQAATSATAEAQQLIPVRSLSVAVGQIFSTIFGGRGDALSRAKQANALAAQAKTAVSNFTTEQQKLKNVSNQLRTAQDPKSQTDLIKRVQDQAKATRLARTEAERLTTASEGAAKGVITQAGAIQNLAAGTLGVVSGTLLFSTALGAAQAGISAVSQVLGPTIERMSGFDATAARVSATLADQTRQSGGAVKQTVALTEAQAGLSSAAAQTISPLLEQRVQTEAGNKALSDSLDLLHTYLNTVKRGGGAAGLTQTQGGLLGTIIGGVPSTSEQVGNELRDVPTTPSQTGPPESQNFLRRSGATTRDQLTRGEQIYYDSLTKSEQSTTAALDESATRIQFFNDAIAKGGEQFKFIAQRDLPDLDANTRELSAKAADLAGAFDIAANIRAGKTILTGPGGAPVTTKEQVQKALGAINTGLTTPDVGLLVKQLTDRIIPAQLAQFRAQGNLQRGVLNPGQFALGQIAAPTPGLSTSTQPFEAGLVGRDSLTGKIDKQAQAAANTVKGQLGGAISYVNDQIQKGHDALVALVPQDLRSEFQGVLADITATGQQISKIQTGISQQQVNLDVAEYNNQLRIARRSLQDAKDLQQGIAGATKDTVGGLEGQNIALQRQLQLLEFELQQRKINFSIATAGFVAPGTTPEERAARIEEAKKEAEFAQKQLDIQKQLAGNQFRGIQITTSRDVTDLVAQIGLLQQGRTLTINTAVASKQLDILNKKQQLLVEQAGTYIEEGVKVTQAALDAAAEVQKQTGKGFSYILGETAKAWGIFGDQAQLVLNALRGTAATPASTTRGHDSAGRIGGQANGIVGDTLGPTQLTVGEAAGEKVAILRNPKLVPSSSLYGASQGGSTGGGAMIQMTVIISGNSVHEETDLEKLAEKVAQKVEDRLMQKTSLFGLRRA